MVIQEPSFMYLYKRKVTVPLLGQGDDLLGVSELGFKSEHFYGFVNVKTGDKNCDMELISTTL